VPESYWPPRAAGPCDNDSRCLAATRSSREIMKPQAIFRCAICTGLLLGTVLAASAVEVTFQVNMGVQTAMGNFIPATDQVFLAGDAINSWSTTASQLTPSTTNADVWVGTFDVPGAAGTTVNYKYLISPASGSGLVWEGNVGAGGAQNRSFALAASPETLAVVYFNNLSNATLAHPPVTFQVNMGVQIAQGTFDPASGTVVVAGDAINNWSTSVSPLVQSLTDSNLWVGTFNVTNPPDSTVAYKFIMNGTWESIANRTFVLSNAAQVLPVAYFNNVTNLAVPIPLQMQVNMAVQVARGNFDPSTGVVEVRGTFNADTGGNWLGGFVLTNSTTAPYLYGGTWVDTNDAPGSVVQYQFVLNNGATWETTGNRLYTLTNANQQDFPVAFFNNVNTLGPLSLGSITGGQATISWTAGPAVRLQKATSLGTWQDVASTLGQSTASVTVGTGQAFFRLIGP
jgi:hypothetical protein